jgi:hypothetical protein
MQFQSQVRPSVGIVFDADLGSTIDDALALGSLYGFQGKGESRVISVSTTKPSLNSAIFGDVLVRFYTGEPGPFAGPAPIGLAMGKASSDTPLMSAVLGKMTPEGKPAFGRAIQQMNDTADPQALIRNALSAQFDGNAIVFLSGPASNLAKVLDMPGFKDLVAAKVRYLAMALGNFGGGAADPQVLADLPAAKKLFAEWPTQIFVAGSEIGESLTFPAASLEKEFAWSPMHPVVEAYRAANGSSEVPGTALAAALYAVRPKEGDFKLSETGTISVGDDGRTKLTPGAGKHQFLIADPAQKEKITRIWVETASTKPVPRAPRFRPPVEQKKQE